MNATMTKPTTQAAPARQAPPQAPDVAAGGQADDQPTIRCPFCFRAGIPVGGPCQDCGTTVPLGAGAPGPAKFNNYTPGKRSGASSDFRYHGYQPNEF
jgi:hypothetical protein